MGYRFIDLTDQIVEGQKKFAIFSTITDTFLYFGPCDDPMNCVFDSVEEFKRCVLSTRNEDEKTLQRLISYIPDNFFENENMG